MTTNLHDKMLAAIDAYFSASNEIEAHIAEEQLLDVRAEINKYKLAAESLNEGLRLDDWDKIGCVNHDCDKCKALAEQPAQQEPEIVQRVKRYAGQTLRTARNPNITARECIELADWLAAHGITKGNT